MKCACCGQCADEATCPSCGEASWLHEDEDAKEDAPKKRAPRKAKVIGE